MLSRKGIAFMLAYSQSASQPSLQFCVFCNLIISRRKFLPTVENKGKSSEIFKVSIFFCVCRKSKLSSRTWYIISLKSSKLSCSINKLTTLRITFCVKSRHVNFAISATKAMYRSQIGVAFFKECLIEPNMERD